MKSVEDIVKIGKVSSININERTARVVFEDKDDMVSGNLIVLINQPPGQKQWLPVVGQMVACLFLATGDGDGFIIGGL